MKNIVKYISLSLVALSAISCDDYFEMRYTNDKTEDQFEADPIRAVGGMLNYGYSSIPTHYSLEFGEYLDCGTDNAVARSYTGSLEKMVTIGDGYLSNTTHPLIFKWKTCYNSIASVNRFIEEVAENSYDFYPGMPEENVAYLTRSRGEALFLRAWNHFQLLQTFAGVDASGELMGIPLMNETMSVNDVEMLSRDTFDACMESIVEDIDKAVDSLPIKYNSTAQNGLTALATAEQFYGRANVPIALMLKSRALLYAASPAYNLNGDLSRYEDAAQAAKDVLDIIGYTLPDVYDISDLGNIAGDKLSSLFYNADDSEETIFPRVISYVDRSSMYQFPQGVNFKGEGKTNPSQNLVDAFPMANGYPISMNEANYDPTKMYEGRDPRFYMTVFYNKETFRGSEIQIYPGGNDYAGGTGVTDITTRTGYFLRKWTSSKVNNVGIGDALIGDYHPMHVYRKVEAFLNFAEAVIEVEGADGGAYGFTARQAIAEVRRRAGIAKDGTDAYLESLGTEDLKELIKNERRIELAFENHRYYDLRRWKSDLNVPVTGIFFSGAGDNVGTVKIITTSSGEPLVPQFKDYMYYGPLPNSEILKNENLTQNKGW
ncbi:MAG: RagB/SusD family nutrient uptake outer membrane protein [Rikenellaceae bacterium]